jgi:hypothetical protein
MLREGPIPRFAHGIYEYLLGVLFIASPFLLEYDSSAATGIAIAVGVGLVVLAATSADSTALVRRIPGIVHVTIDVLLAIFLIAAPFLLGFDGEAAPRNFFLVFGVVHLLVCIGTRFRDAADVPSSAEPAI